MSVEYSQQTPRPLDHIHLILPMLYSTVCLQQENCSSWIRWFAVLAPGTSPGCSCAWLTLGWCCRTEKQRWRTIPSRTTAGNEVDKIQLQAGCQTQKGGIIGLAVQEFWSHVALWAAMLQWSGRKADEEWHNYITRNCAGLRGHAELIGT